MNATAGTAPDGRGQRDEASGRDPVRTPMPRWHTALRIVGLLVAAVVIVAVLRTKMPSPGEFASALRRAHWWWVVAALVLQVASIGMMVRQQRRLLRAFGVPVSYRRMGAITYSSTAIAMSVPAGGAVSAGYAYRKYRDSGASAATAASVMLLSGLMSMLALVLLYLVGLLIAGWTHLLVLGRQNPSVTVLLGIGVLACLIGAVRFLGRRRRRSRRQLPTPRLDRFEVGHPKLGAVARQALEAVRTSAWVPATDWNLVLTQSAANWLLDAASLYAATMAFQLRVDLWALALLFLGIQVVRQIPVTPGGIGLIEASLLAGLISAGAAQGAAAAAIVVYRLFSCWLLIPVGFGMMGLMALRDRRRTQTGDGAGDNAGDGAASGADDERGGDPAAARPADG